MKVLLATSHFENYFRAALPDDDVEVVDLRTHRHMEGDLLIFTGGADLNPRMYGANPSPYTFSDDNRDSVEREIYVNAITGDRVKARKILGVCRGLQFLNVMAGGNLYQHLPDLGKGHPAVHDIVWHKQAKLLLPISVVNSMHHQAIKYIGDRFRYTVMGKEPKTEVIESVLWRDNIFAVQFHPEFMPQDGAGKTFFDAIRKWVEDNEPLLANRRTTRKKKVVPSRIKKSPEIEIEAGISWENAERQVTDFGVGLVGFRESVEANTLDEE